MPLFHGTSLARAINTAQNGALPSKDGFYYCFDNQKPESAAGVLSFATAGGLRGGVLGKKNYIDAYAALNPTFPTGLKGLFIKSALKMAGKAWAQEQFENATGVLDHMPAIIVFEDHPAAISRSRKGIINEVVIPASQLGVLKIKTLYVDDTALDLPAVKELAATGIDCLPISAWAAAVEGRLAFQKKHQRKPPAPTA